MVRDLETVVLEKCDVGLRTGSVGDLRVVNPVFVLKFSSLHAN